MSEFITSELAIELAIERMERVGTKRKRRVLPFPEDKVKPKKRKVERKTWPYWTEGC